MASNDEQFNNKYLSAFTKTLKGGGKSEHTGRPEEQQKYPFSLPSLRRDNEPATQNISLKSRQTNQESLLHILSASNLGIFNNFPFERSKHQKTNQVV